MTTGQMGTPLAIRHPIERIVLGEQTARRQVPFWSLGWFAVAAPPLNRSSILSSKSSVRLTGSFVCRLGSPGRFVSPSAHQYPTRLRSWRANARGISSIWRSTSRRLPSRRTLFGPSGVRSVASMRTCPLTLLTETLSADEADDELDDAVGFAEDILAFLNPSTVNTTASSQRCNR